MFRSNRTINMSLVRPSNLLPMFVDVRVHEVDDTTLDDSCPALIWSALINQSTPVLPYRTIDDYDRAGAQCVNVGTLPTVVQENDGLRATFFANKGGKLASLFDKKRGVEVLFNNPVYQPANLGRLNAWTSGGVEWNWPRHGHSVFTQVCVPFRIRSSQRH